MDEPIPSPGRRSYWLFAALVVAVAATLRLHGLSQHSITIDESTIVAFASSILEQGYPAVRVGTMEIQLATYELYSYILALAIGLFGTSEVAVRLPSALFGIGTAYLIYSAGCKWFNLRTGIIAGLLYATASWAIFWSQNAFHPQSHQFFGMLTLMQAVIILRAQPVPTRTYYLAALFFCSGFLCWEGLGFILPVLAISALIVSWGDWKWLKNRHLWIACAIVSAVIVAQGVRRVLLQDNYLNIGFGRSEIAGPELAFVQPYYQPYFYMVQIFGWYTQLVLTIMFGLGLLFARGHWHFRFLAVFVVTAVLIMANLLSYYAFHYIYFALPAFVIAVAGATVIIVDRLGGGASSPLRRGGAWAGAILLTAAAGLELATAGVVGLKTYSITANAQNPPRGAYGTRLAVELIDYRGLTASLRTLYVPGDPILRMHPFSLRQYTGMHGDTGMQNWTFQKVIFDPGGERVYYIDKGSGNPILRTLREFDDVLAREDRMWFIAPDEIFASAIDKETLAYFQRRAKLKAESYRGAVHVWSR